MSSTTVFYNGVTLDQVRITEYRIDNPANHDSPQSKVLLHSVSGEALVFNKSGDFSSNQNFCIDLVNKLNVPRRSLKIKIETGTGGQDEFTLVDTTAGSTAGDIYVTDNGYGPFFRANVTQITGTKALMVNFTVEFAQAVSAPLNRIKSFYCTASFSIDEMGMTTIRKTGSLQIISQPNFYAPGQFRVAGLAFDRAGSPDSVTFDDPYRVGDYARNDVVVDFITSNELGGHFADYYRRFVSGNLYRGFRRMRQEYAMDESRTRLVFDVTDQEFARGLPAPARVGNCSYTFERSLEDNALLGIKHFIASAKGDRNVTAGALLTLCIRLSQNRINWAQDFIMKIRVTEENMLTENAITFEVIAKATSSQEFSAISTEGEGSAGSVTPIKDDYLLLRNILSPLKTENGTFEFVPAFQPDAYGGSLIVRVTPSVYDATRMQFGNSAEFQMPTTLQLSEQNPVVYSFPNGLFDAAFGQTDDRINRYVGQGGNIIGRVPGGVNRKDLERNATPNTGGSNGNIPLPRRGPHKSKAGSKVDVSTGLFAVPSVSVTPKTRLVQFRMPVATITDFHDATTMNESPQRMLPERAGGKGAYIANYSFAVNSGHGDLNGNRNQSMASDRVTVVTCPDDIPTSGSSPTNPAFDRTTVVMNGVTTSVIRFFPDKLAMPQDMTQGEYASIEDENLRPSYTAGLGAKDILA